MIRRHSEFYQFVYVLTLGFVAVAGNACSGSLFKVKPAIDLPVLPAAAKSADAGGVRTSVAPLLSDEESQDLFEANLPLGGVLPLRVEVAYQISQPSGDATSGTPAMALPLQLKRARFRLHDGEGHQWKLLSTKQAIKRILKANGVFLYNPYSRKEFEKDFAAYAIDLTTPLAAAERRRQGFIFFQTPDKSPLRSPRGLVLSVAGLPQPLEIPIN